MPVTIVPTKKTKDKKEDTDTRPFGGKVPKFMKKYYEEVDKYKKSSGQDEAEKQGRNANIPDDAGRFDKKKGGTIDKRKKGKTKVKRPEKGKKSPLSTAQSIGNLFSFSPKKHIMELKTNKPRLMKGANLMNPKKADLDKDGKLSSYEKARGKAIEKNIRGTPKKAKDGMLMSDRDKQVQEQKNRTQAKTMKEKVFNNPRISDRDLQIINNIYSKDTRISDQDIKTLKRIMKTK